MNLLPRSFFASSFTDVKGYKTVCSVVMCGPKWKCNEYGNSMCEKIEVTGTFSCVGYPANEECGCVKSDNTNKTLRVVGDFDRSYKNGNGSGGKSVGERMPTEEYLRNMQG